MTGVVLCGGASRRMGRDKAWLEVAGEAMLARAVRLLEPHVDEVVLACGARERYADLGLRLALDAQTGGGPLLGLAAGLEAARGEWVLLLACDLPFAGPAIESLLEAVEPSDELVHHQVDGLPEPLCALYRRSVLPALGAALARGERRMTCFWHDVRVRALPAPDAGAFRNLNTPEDLARVRSETA